MKNLLISGFMAVVLLAVACSSSEDNTQEVVYDAKPSIQLDTNSFEYNMRAGYYTFDSLTETVFTDDTLFYIIDIKDYKSGSTKISLLQADTVAFAFPELNDDYYSDTIELVGYMPQKIRIESLKFTGTLSFKLYSLEP
jgi:hypothetical protein